MKKRILTLLLASLMAVPLLAACNNETKQNGDNASQDGRSATGKFDDVRLNMLICWNGEFKTAPDQYNNAVAEKIREEIGVTVEYEGTMKKETEALNLMFASGDMPDIVNAPYWGGNGGETEVVKKAAAEEQLLPIEDELPKYENLSRAYDIGVISQAYLERDLEIPEFNGHRYLLPQETPGDEAAIDNWAYGVFVRGDVPKALGIDEKEIKTFDQLYDFMEKARDYGFKDINGNDCIVATTYHEGWNYSNYVESFEPGPQLTPFLKKDDGTYIYKTLDEDYYIGRNLAIWKMVNEGILDKECFKHADSAADEKVGNGTALFAATQYSVVIKSTQLTGLYNNNEDMRYIPVGPMNYADGTPLVQTEQMGRYGSPVLFFPRTCTNLDAALTYIDYANSKEGLTLIQYGIEGETFEYNDEGQPRLLQKYLDRMANGEEEAVKDDLREYGANYMQGRLICANLKVTWFGESDAGRADAANPYLDAYKQARPAVRLEGYPLSKLGEDFDRYDEVSAVAFEGTTEQDYRERAYFADTEEEARQILMDYLEYLTTQKNGVFLEWNEFVNEQAAARPDAAH